jgi:signal transduction histidine kinase
VDDPTNPGTLERDALEALIRDLTHDLKGPLANIKGFVELLEGGGLSPEQERHFLSRIRYNTGVMNRLVTDLGELARIGVRREPAEELEAADVVREVLEQFEGARVERGARIEVGALPRVRYPRARLLQVFAQLVDNAFRHSAGREPLRIAIRCRSEAGEHRFEVEDNGPGVAPEERERIFDPFHARAKKVTGASGLGLTIAERIVEQQGGRIAVGDSPGGGATFTFTVPREREGAPDRS